MRKINLIIIVTLLFITSIFGISRCTKVEAGHVGVKVYLLGTTNSLLSYDGITWTNDINLKGTSVLIFDK